MLLDHMEYVAASDADSIVWIFFLFSLSSSFMLSDLFAANGYSFPFSAVFAFPFLFKKFILKYHTSPFLASQSLTVNSEPASLPFTALTSDLCEAKVCPNKGVLRWIVAAKEERGLADQ